MEKKTEYDYKNLTKSQQNCLSLIESLGIYELRALARVFGDNAPTTIKRNEHIAFVMNKILSGEDIKPIPLRQGRPYKELSNIEGILTELSHLTGKDYSLTQTNVSSQTHINKVVHFKQVDNEIYSKKINPIKVCGVLCEKSEKEMFLVNQNGAKKSVLVKKDDFPSLDTYDFITGTAVVMNSNKEYILDTVETINFQNLKTYQRKKVEFEQIIPEKTLEYDGKSFLLGTRYVLKTPKFTEYQGIKNLIKKFKENGIVTIALIPNVMPEDEILLQGLGFDNLFKILYEDSAFSVNETLNIFIEHIKHLQEVGLSLVIFVEDVVSLANYIDFAFKNNTKSTVGHTEAASNFIKKIFMLAKAGKNNQNITLITTFDDIDTIDSLYLSDVYKICKKLNF